MQPVGYGQKQGDAAQNVPAEPVLKASAALFDVVDSATQFFGVLPGRA